MPNGEPTGETPQPIVPPTPVGRTASRSDAPQVIAGTAPLESQSGAEATPGRQPGEGVVVDGVGLTPAVADRLAATPIDPEPSDGPPTGASMRDLDERLGGVSPEDSVGIMHAAQVGEEPATPGSTEPPTQPSGADGESAVPPPADASAATTVPSPSEENSGHTPPVSGGEPTSPAPLSSEPPTNPPEPPANGEPPTGPAQPEAAPVVPKEGAQPEAPATTTEAPKAAPVQSEGEKRADGSTPPPPEQLTKEDTNAVVQAQQTVELPQKQQEEIAKQQASIDALRAGKNPNQADVQQERLNMQTEAARLNEVDWVLREGTPEQQRGLVDPDNSASDDEVARRLNELRAQVPARRAELQERQNAYNAHAKEMDSLAQEADKHNKKGETHQEGVEKAELQQLRDLANAEATARFAESADPALVEKAIQMAHNPDDPLHANALLANAKDAQDLTLNSQAEKDYQTRLRKEFDKKENRKDLRRAAKLADRAKKKGYSEIEGIFADRINKIHERQRTEATIGLINADRAKAARKLRIPESELDNLKTQLQLHLAELNKSISDSELEKQAKQVMRQRIKKYGREKGEAWKHWREHKNWKNFREALKPTGKWLLWWLLRIFGFAAVVNFLTFVGITAVGVWVANKALGGQGGH